ncbi:T9SS type A sorting domain-containing protein, partial [candidate division KSB1 bacterium]|nr:T9SS type A sorting domain-containing protein [candidate division KSB1 bacterium]
DAEITWTHSTVQNLDLSINIGILNVTVLDPEWNGTETVTLTATDPGGKFDTMDVSFTVNPVNDPPVVQPIVVNPISEGSQFPPISLVADDPDNSAQQIQWTASGQQQLDVNIQQGANPSATVTTPDADWYGSEQVTFTATDPAGESDSKVAVFTVNNVNDPPEILPVLDQSIRYNQEFAVVNLDTCVQDIDNTPDQIYWSYTGNTNLAISIVNRTLTITRIDPDWTGLEAVTFTANDGQQSDSYTATFTVVYHNDPPQISDIFSETISENGVFETIYLDDKVEDPDHADSELTWTFSGDENLQIQEIADRVLQIAPVDSEWTGTETITFKVTDPGNLSDSTSASYTIMPVNDPPEISGMSGFSFNEDTTYVITSAELKFMVHDPDNNFEELTYSLDNAVHTKIEKEPATGNLILSAAENWFGTENVLFSVTDAMYAKTSQPITITVKPLPDPPLAFDLLMPFDNTAIVIRPEMLEFSWQSSIDPDDEPVTYSWNLSQEMDFSHIIERYNNISDTTFTYTLPQHFEPGLYYWKVIASDQSGNCTPCNNVNLFNLNFDIGIAEDPSSQQPDKFALYQNHPNPFNPETRITYQLPKACHVRLAVYNNVGQLIKMLVNEDKSAGSFSIYWNGTDEHNAAVSSGIYIYKLRAGDFVMARKMLYLR